AYHVHDRGAERLNLSSENVDALQRDADKLWYGHARHKLHGPRYFSKITDDHNHVRGYAAFKRVGPPVHGRLILSPILSKEMASPAMGQDISHFFNTSLKDKVPKHPLTPEPYKGMPALPNNNKNN